MRGAVDDKAALAMDKYDPYSLWHKYKYNFKN
jgi:hypothetical protein